MSSRILLDDAGPGTREPAPPPAPEPQDRGRAAPEPQERAEAVAADDSPKPEEGTQRPSDAPAEASERQPSESEKDYQRRIDQLTRDKYAAQRERDQLRAEWQRFQQQQQPPPQPGQPDRAQYERDVQQAVANRAFDQACNSLYARGREEYGAEMDDAVQALVAVGYGDVQQNPAAYLALNELAESPNGHRLYRELAGDLENAARILRMPPNMIIREIARMEARIGDAAGGNGAPPAEPAARAPVSRAPDPVRHIGGRSAQPPHRLDDPNMDMASWIRERDRQERRSRIAR